jgi:multidrug efflux pump subunit AcrA (membrane-fusion protein)
MKAAWFSLVVVVVGCERRAPTAPQPSEPTARSVATRWVESRPAEDTTILEAPARVLPSPDSVASLAPPLQARIVKVRVHPGQRVVQYEPLIDVLMPDVLHAAGDLVGEQLKVEAFSRRKLQLEALKAEGLARVAELAEVEALLATARADSQAARATLRASGVSDRLAEGLVSGDGVVSLRSPIAGIVSSVDAMVGEVREPAGRTLVTVVGEGDGRVEARLPSSVGPAARFSFVSGAQARAIELISISPRLEAADGSRLAWFSIPDAGLSVGATGRVRIGADPSWRVVPARALLEVEGRTRVRVRGTDGTAVLLDVRVIARSGAEAVVDGLASDAMVAAEADAP